MIIENLPSLQIHRLSQSQYEKLVDAGKADDKALYLVPDDGSEDVDIDIAQEIGKNPSPEEIPSSKAVADYVEAKVPKFTTDTDLNDPNVDLGNTIATAQMMKNYVEEAVPTVVDDLSVATFDRDQKVPSVQATKDYVNGEIAALIGDDDRYPKALDTINEISAAIKDNVETLDIDRGVVELNGRIDCIFYSENSSDEKRGLFSKIFR